MDSFHIIDSQLSCEDELLLSGPLTFSAVNAALHFRSSTSSSNEPIQSIQSNHFTLDQPLHFGHGHCSSSDSKASIFVPSQVHKSVVPNNQPVLFNTKQKVFEFTASLPQSKSNKDVLSQKSSDSSSAQPPDPGLCHALNSYVVHLACHALLELLSCILATYGGDIEYTVHATRIDGLVFCSDHAVHFVLYIHENYDEETQKSTVEYRRGNGDAMASATFWNWIQQQIESRSGTATIPSQFCEVLTSKSTNMSYKVYLDNITRSIQQNDYLMVDELRVLYQSLGSNCDDELSAQILQHKMFCNVIIGALQHPNVCVSRLAILILQRIAGTPKGRTFCAGQVELFGNVIKLFCCHQSAFMKRHAIRFLGGLVDCTTWSMNKIDEAQLVWRIKEYGKISDDDSVTRIQNKLAAMGH